MSDVHEQILKVLDKLNPQEQAQVRARLSRILTHRKAIASYPTPAHLAQLTRPTFLQTPMLDKLDEVLMRAESGEVRRIVVNTPPQEGKTSRLQDACAWMLLRNPKLRIGFASYEQSIAAQSSMEIRRIIETHGSGYRGQARSADNIDVLGLTLDPDHAQQSSWRLADVPGRKNQTPGGVIAVGVGSSLTGRPVDVLVIDDPIKDAKQADSKVYRKAVVDWYRSVALTRLPPSSIVIIVQTRWHEEDLTGWVLKEDKLLAVPKFAHVNIMAQATEGDILGRAPGEYLLSARGRTEEDWEDTKTAVGSRWWNAMYQGNPAPPEGGTFKRAYFDKNRVAEAPSLRVILTMVDPADNTGDGDEAGIITGGIGEDGHIYFLEDNSGHFTVAGWIRAAIFAMLRNRAHRIVYEQSLSSLRRHIAMEWKVIRRQVREIIKAQSMFSSMLETDWTEINPVVFTEVLKTLCDEDDDQADISLLSERLRDLWPYVPQIWALPEGGPPVKSIRAEGSKQHRADMASVPYEGGLVHHVGDSGKFSEYEHEMATWLEGQDSPNRMDTGVHLVDQLGKINKASRVEKTPAGNQMPRRQQPIPQIMRSTRYGR